MTTKTQEWEAIIGMEVHAELMTASKMFCSCAVVDTTVAEPNTATCAICSGMPGVLPVINKKAVEYSIMVGLALNCEIPPYNIFARKNYFYPDLPKGYQISQYEYPLAVNGWIDIDLPDGGTKRIGIRRAHLEEDTGKLSHMDAGSSLVDYNRSGVPLLEIVTEPDIRSADEAEAYARKLRAILQYLGVNSGDMSKGVLRVEANISVRPVGEEDFRTRTEVKNLNSIRNMYRATQYEIDRQINVWESGGKVRQETMGWDDTRQATVTQRSKEFAEDYRYFPEPDLPIVEVSREWVEEIRSQMPELPDAKRQRFMEELGLGAYDAGVLIADRAIADYFEEAIAVGGDAKKVANWIITEVFRLMNNDSLEREDIGTIKVTPQKLVELIELLDKNTVNNNTAKKVLALIYADGGSPAGIVKEKGLAQESDEGILREAVLTVLEENPDEVQRYLEGEEKVANFLMGQVMRAMRGKGNAQVVKQLIAEELETRRNG
jgi:aspartyl-tRNA(Asn)/glutamyl-tRNA(Gln) amidotransferase subunit B